MIRKLFVLAFTMAVAACASYTPVEDIAASEKPVPEPSLEKIAEGVWIHKSYKNIEPWGPILSQGLVVFNEKNLLLIDTAWTDSDTSKLLDRIEAEISDYPGQAYVTHAHQDKMGGMQVVIDRGWLTYASETTNEDAIKRGLIPASTNVPIFRHDMSTTLQGWSIGRIEFLHPGPGHTRDNVVAYDPKTKILFGGCLIRPGASNTLGNTADADIDNWADAVRKVAAEFPEAEIIIPSHGPMGGRELFDHTIGLAEAAASQ